MESLGPAALEGRQRCGDGDRKSQVAFGRLDKANVKGRECMLLRRHHEEKSWHKPNSTDTAPWSTYCSVGSAERIDWILGAHFNCLSEPMLVSGYENH